MICLLNHNFWGTATKTKPNFTWNAVQCRFELVLLFISCVPHTLTRLDYKAGNYGQMGRSGLIRPCTFTSLFYCYIRCTVKSWAGVWTNALNCFTCTIITGACLCLNIFSVLSGLYKTSSSQTTHTAHCGCALCSVSNFLELHNLFGSFY